MELMQENIALNEPQTSVAKIVDESGQADDETQTGPTLSARTLDWDNPLPDWVTESHPDIIMQVNTSCSDHS
jgi:hypothetical protein